MDFFTEGNGTTTIFTAELLKYAIEHETILYAKATLFDSNKQLHFHLGSYKGIMPYEECAIGVKEGRVRDIALITRVGRLTAFVVTGIQKINGQTTYLLSRKRAQEHCTKQYLSHFRPGDIIPCTVTHIEPFGAFCDIGCGISALLPIDSLSVSRITSPADRVYTGQNLYCVIRAIDIQGRFVLSLKELLGTWQENANQFKAGETVIGTVRSIEDYGVFIELTPNLAGLAELDRTLKPGQSVSVYIKSVLPEKMKVKLVVLGHVEDVPPPPLHYYIQEGHISSWVYSTESCPRRVAVEFD